MENDISRKRLSRTVIEGGRASSNKWERRNSHNEERTAERDYCYRVSKDPECADDEDIIEKSRVFKDFKDKINPMYRWLHAQIGRPWNDVYSEVKNKFDDRTTAGRHIVNDHLKSSISLPNDPYDVAYGGGSRYGIPPEEPNVSYSKNDFYVDDEGVLQVKRHISRKQHIEKFDTKRIINWLSGRAIGKIGNKIFWFVPADKNKKRGGSNRQWSCVWGYQRSWHTPYRHLSFHFLVQENVYKRDKKTSAYLKDEKGNLIVESVKSVWNEGNPSFRQDRKLNDKEMQFWNSLPKFYQDRILERSPLLPKK